MEGPKYEARRPLETVDESFTDREWAVETKKVLASIPGIKRQGRAWAGLLWPTWKVRSLLAEDKSPDRGRELQCWKQLRDPPESKNVTTEKLGGGKGSAAWLRFFSLQT